MWINHIFLAFVGLASGLAVAGGTFALIVSLKIIPRIVGKGHLASRTVWFENMIVLGGIWGTIFAVFPMIRFPVGHWFIALYGLCSGIQVGCLLMALAEIVNVFPVIFRRFDLKTGISWVIISLAAGKLAGSFWYFYKNLSC
ncbi:MAG: stage V sporulation protein AB [Lachnospiraceae bacterium]|jgi:hypothetical protein|uniref:stage V sporulation protein AB n=1 Tax=Roseburia sp. 1XD42-69 TaxID=2320088 RepID=UPI000EA0CC65|nr:stage V sporulation protein AB [Roseburia sp. 1XD42-69]MCI8876819.1 stage V sporulation protein AB [Lachnospiraceae bacterium]MCX4320191.1 stage V sporulation protein AB [Lachnospiraceae bacterium]RKJ66818.1 stage V sporulation protein AB [Roseburia sp. 1XD42-69]